jgi:hypothetical protein
MVPFYHGTIYHSPTTPKYDGASFTRVSFYHGTPIVEVCTGQAARGPGLVSATEERAGPLT